LGCILGGLQRFRTAVEGLLNNLGEVFAHPSGCTLGPELNRELKIGLYQAYDFSGWIYRVLEYWHGHGNGDNPGPRRVP